MQWLAHTSLDPVASDTPRGGSAADRKLPTRRLSSKQPHPPIQLLELLAWNDRQHALEWVAGIDQSAQSALIRRSGATALGLPCSVRTVVLPCLPRAPGPRSPCRRRFVRLRCSTGSHKCVTVASDMSPRLATKATRWQIACATCLGCRSFSLLQSCSARSGPLLSAEHAVVATAALESDQPLALTAPAGWMPLSRVP